MLADSPSNAAITPSFSKKQEQLESGRRKLLEYRKKKAEERRNKEKNKPSEETTHFPGKKFVVNFETLQNEVAFPLDGTKTFTLLSSENSFPESEEDAGFCSNKTNSTEDAGFFNSSIKTAGKGYFDKSLHAYAGEIRDFVDIPSTRDDNATELMDNSSMYERIYLRTSGPWSVGIQKSDPTPSVDDFIRRRHVKDTTKGYFVEDQNMSKRRSGSVSASDMWDQQNVLMEKTIDVYVPSANQDLLAPTFQLTQKPNDMNTSCENLQSLIVRQDTSYESPFKLSVSKYQMVSEPNMLNPFNSRVFSSSDVLLGTERIIHTWISANTPESQMASKNDDFVALEQHINELTQEKYSLQRALDVARSLSESLSQQNTTLAEDFNSQAAVINRFQEELEKKKEELAAQTLVLSSLMKESEKAQQENNSAVERSQILAGEVISLEEKVLKLRSNELKLQREVENLKSENESYRGHFTNIDIDRENLRSVLEALQEDKKILQSKLQEKLANDDSKYQGTRQGEQKAVATSTDDLGKSNSSSITESTASLNYLPGMSPTVDTLPHHDSEMHLWTGLSWEEQRLVEKIDVHITELFIEKTSLLETVREESFQVHELQVSNMELSKKLLLQTQKFELAVARNRVNGEDVTDFNADQEEVYFVNEADEDVERVLGWVTHLFPSGSSRRQTSKLL